MHLQLFENLDILLWVAILALAAFNASSEGAKFEVNKLNLLETS